MHEADTDLQPSREAARALDREPALWVLIACVVALLATAFSPPLLRMYRVEIWQALGVTEASWSVVLAVKGLFVIVFGLAAGALGDLFGRRRLLLIALVACLLINLVLATTTHQGMFLVAEFLLPVSDAFIRTLTVTQVLLAFTGQTRLYALIVYSTVSLVAYLLSPMLAAQAGQATGMRSAAYIGSLVLALAGLVLVAKKVPESRASTDLRLQDLLALCAWVAGVCALIFGLVLGGSLGWSHPLVLTTLAVGAAILFALLWLQRKPLEKEEWRFVLRFERSLTIAVVAGVILNLALYAISVQILNFLIRIQHFSSFPALLRLSPILIGPILLGALAGRLAKRVGVRSALSIGLLLVAVAAAGFGFLQPHISYWALAGLLVLLGLGFIVGNAPYLILLSWSVPRDLAATVQAVGRTTTQLGSALAYAFMLNLIAAFGQEAFLPSGGLPSLSQEFVEEKLWSLAAAAGDALLAFMPQAEVQIVGWVSPAFERAYTVGLSRAMLVLAGLCVFGAVLVRVGLPEGRED